LLTINGLLIAALQYPAVRITKNVRHSLALAVGGLFFGLGWLVMGFAGVYVMVIAAMVIVTLGQVIVAPTSLAVVGEHSPPGMRGRYQGFFGISETMGVSIGPFMGGVLLDIFPQNNLGVWGPIGLCALFAGVGFLIWGRVFKK